MLALIASAGAGVQAWAAGPAPTLRAAPSGVHGFPFRTSTLNLAGAGYVEQEFLLSGTAQAYVPVAPLGSDGRWNVTANPGVTAPYVTRILVRRPTDPARFNGTVVVEWNNASGGSDTQSDWLYMHEEILRQGYAYIGVTAQYVGVQTLLAWEGGPGSRYASLFHPGDSFAYDIFSQAGAVVLHGRPGDPRALGELTGRVSAVLATGFSQSAAWLTTYFNAIHRLGPVYNAFLIHDAGFDAPLSLDVASFATGDPPPGGVPATPFIDTPYPLQLRDDQSQPALIVLSEFGLSDDGNAAARTFHLQPDSGHIRVWEFAGAPHLESGWFRDLVADDRKTYPGTALDPCDGPPGIPSIVHAPGVRAAVTALSLWARGASAPRPAPRMSLQVPSPPDDFDQSVVFNRDAKTQLVRGGIRLPAVTVPVATLNGNREDFDWSILGPGGQCVFVGVYDPWDHDSDLWDGQAGVDPSTTPEPDLQVLYPTHQNYVERVSASALQSVVNGYLRPADGVQLALDAVHAAVP
ncbi:MAG: hypothetical protein JSR36_07080 [Proteobacteria bacterium]|nr:hypothetical protein [Pseudomonadota bacterium]